MKATYIDHMGSDLSVVNAARVSFGKRSEMVRSGEPTGEWALSQGETNPTYLKLSERDRVLIRFLARGCTTGDWEDLVLDFLLETFEPEEIDALLTHVRRMPTHWTPFGHTAITLHIKAPIFVARQLGKHQVGMVWNEVSRRYVTDEPEFYTPEVWRKAAKNVKQGSSDESVCLRKEYVWCDDNKPKYGWDDYTLEELYLEHLEREAVLYEKLVERGVCPEQARMVLPQSMYTEWYWTGNLYSFANVFIQRTDSHAQREVQVVAKQIGDIIKPLFPVSWNALTG